MSPFQRLLETEKGMHRHGRIVVFKLSLGNLLQYCPLENKYWNWQRKSFFFFLTSVQESIACRGAAVTVLASGQNPERTSDSWPQHKGVAGNPLMSTASLAVQTDMHLQ